ncbi:MAG: MerR family transcriptional regulator [Comamonas sp.]
MSSENALPTIPAKRYFTIGEVADLCGVKPHVLRYWEQEFSQLRPMKRRGNRRYYQHHEVLMIRRIRDLLYDQGFTISGARNKLQEYAQLERSRRRNEALPDPDGAWPLDFDHPDQIPPTSTARHAPPSTEDRLALVLAALDDSQRAALRDTLFEIRDLLGDDES